MSAAEAVTGTAVRPPVHSACASMHWMTGACESTTCAVAPQRSTELVACDRSTGVPAGEAHSATMFGGQVSVGDVVSTTLKVASSLLVVPVGSDTVRLTVCAPRA